MSREPHDDRFRELLPAYALGALDGPERAELEAHLAECAACRVRLEAWRRTVGDLAEGVVPATPPAGVRASLLDRVRSEAAAERPASRVAERRRWIVALAAVVVVAALTALLLGVARARLGSELEATRSRVAELERRLAAAQGDLAETRVHLTSLTRLVQVLSSARPERQVVLAGLDPAPGAHGRLFLDPETRRAVFVADHLPALPAGRDYQLWTIVAGTPRSAGVFRSDAQGHALLEVDQVPPERADAWAVTIEPAGGVPRPTGAMVLKG